MQSHHLPHFRFTPWCLFVPPHTSGSPPGAGLSRPTPQAHAMVLACPAPHLRLTPWCWLVPPHTSGSRHGAGLSSRTCMATSWYSHITSHTSASHHDAGLAHATLRMQEQRSAWSQAAQCLRQGTASAIIFEARYGHRQKLIMHGCTAGTVKDRAMEAQNHAAH